MAVAVGEPADDEAVEDGQPCRWDGARIDAGDPARGDIDPDERVVALITGEGLKTLDAVRGTFEAHEIDPTVESFSDAFASAQPV